MKPITIEKVARSLYGAYGESAGWKNYQGLPMPRWEDLTDAIRVLVEGKSGGVCLSHIEVRHG